MPRYLSISGDVVEQPTLPDSAQFGDQAARDQRGVDDGLGRKVPPDLGHHHHELDLSARIVVETEPQDSDLGELVPHFPTPAEFCVGDLVAALLVVAARPAGCGWCRAAGSVLR